MKIGIRTCQDVKVPIFHIYLRFVRLLLPKIVYIMIAYLISSALKRVKKNLKEENNSMKNKLIATSLCLAMLVSMLAACGNAETAETKTEESKVESSSKEVEKESSVPEEPEEIPVVTIWDGLSTYDEFDDLEDVPYFKALQEGAGVDLEFLDATGGVEALSLMIASDDLPDIIIGQDSYFSHGVITAVEEGTILALNDLMDQGLLPNYKEYLDSHPIVDKLAKTDDGIYAKFPMIREEDSALITSGLAIRQDWLDDLNMEQPRTLQDLEEIMVAFKEEKESSGMIFCWGSYKYFMNAFNFTNNMYVGEDGKVKYGYLTDEYQEFMTLFSRWYAEGLIDTDAFSMSRETFLSKIAMGNTGVITANIGGEFNAILPMEQENPGMNWQPIKNLAIEEGGSYPYNRSQYYVVDNFGGYIAGGCENLEAAAKVMDYFYSEEGYILTNFGVEGETYEVVDGKYKFTDYVINNPDSKSITTALAEYAGSANKPFIVSAEAQKMGYPQERQRYAQEYWRYNGPEEGVARDLPTLSMTLEETEEYNFIMTDINTYVAEMTLKFILGTEPLENLPSFVERLKEMDIERAIEIKQNAYDRYLLR